MLGTRRGSVIQGHFPRGLSEIVAMRQRLARTAPGVAAAHKATSAPIQRHAANAVELPPAMTRFAQRPGQPLPAQVRQKMESFFKTSFADVRVHVGTEAPSLGAIAFTQGQNIHFAPGQYNPSTPQGQKILGHELAHVVQQRAGRVRNPFGSGVAVVQDPMLEVEAERLGMRASTHQAPLQPKAARSSMGCLPHVAPVRSVPLPFTPVTFGTFGGQIQRVSKLESTVKSESGQIYGIWENEEYPNKINVSSLDASKCLYIGKTARGKNLGGRFEEHCKFDYNTPWCIHSNSDYSSNDDECWPYVVRNVWMFNGLTKLDVAVAEQWFLQHYLDKGAKLFNKRNEITPNKFKRLKKHNAFTTRDDYGSWKPKNIKEYRDNW
jgi:hypothetical protein